MLVCILALFDDGCASLCGVNPYCSCMTGARSPACRARRHERAIARGYLLPRPRLNSCWIEVPCELAPRLKVMAKSLAVHHSHNGMLETPTHFARTAALRADVPALLREDALRLHRQANRAKHAWAPTHAPAVSIPTVVKDEDPLSACDPWAGARLPSPPCAVPSSVEDPWACWSRRRTRLSQTQPQRLHTQPQDSEPDDIIGKILVRLTHIESAVRGLLVSSAGGLRVDSTGLKDTEGTPAETVAADDVLMGP